MNNTSSWLEILTNYLFKAWEYLIPITFCEKGYAIVRVTLGKPGKWISSEGNWWSRSLFKIPVLQKFDKVNTKLCFSYSNAHAFYNNSCKTKLIPYNYVTDFQVEYQIVHPYYIYLIDSETNNTQKQCNCFINNIIHNKLNDLILNNDTISTTNIKKAFDEIIEKYSTVNLSTIPTSPEECIVIKRVILTSLEQNICFRSTI